MNICIRASGGGTVGLGHIVRTSALASALVGTSGGIAAISANENKTKDPTENAMWPASAYPPLPEVFWCVDEDTDGRLCAAIGREIGGEFGDLILARDCDKHLNAEVFCEWVRSRSAAFVIIDDYGPSDADVDRIWRRLAALSSNSSVVDDDCRANCVSRPLLVVMDDHQSRLSADVRLGPWVPEVEEMEEAVLAASLCADAGKIAENSLTTGSASVGTSTLLVSRAHLLRGPQFHLVRPEFLAQRAPEGTDPSRCGLAVCFGGTDFKHMTRELLETLLAAFESDARVVDVVRGTPAVPLERQQCHRSGIAAEPLTLVASDSQADEQGLDALVEQWPAGGQRLGWVDAAGMAALFASSRAAVTSASGVGCEAVSMKCPTVAVAWIDNQEPLIAPFQRAGLTVVRTAKQAADALLMNNVRPAQAAEQLDVFGAWRVAATLWDKSRVQRNMSRDGSARLVVARDCENSSGQRFAMRSASLNDVQLLVPLFDARTMEADKEPTKMPLVTNEAVLRWLVGVLQAPNQQLLVAESRGAGSDGGDWAAFFLETDGSGHCSVIATSHTLGSSVGTTKKELLTRSVLLELITPFCPLGWSRELILVPTQKASA